MRSRYFLLFLILVIVLLIILSYLRFPYFRYLINEAFNKNDCAPVIYEAIIFNESSDEIPDKSDSSRDMIRSTREDIHTVLEDGIWGIEHPSYIPQFGGDLQNTGVYPGDGIRGIQIIDSDLMLDGFWPFHKGKLVYKIRHGGLICSSPAVYDRIIYFGTNDGHFYAVDLESGQEKWVVRIGRASKKKKDMLITTDSCPPAPAIFSSPVIYDGMAFFGTAYGYVYALDIKNGSIIWKAEIAGLHLANPKFDKDCLYIGSKDRHLYKLDAKTGNIVWKFETQGEILTTPAIYEDRIFINCQDGHLYAINIEGNLSWKIDMGVPTRNSPVIYEGIVFIDTDYFHAFNVYTCREIWRAGPYNNISQCAASKGRVYFRGIDEQHSSYNYLNIYSYNLRNGKLEWKSEIEYYEKKAVINAETGTTELWDSGVSGNPLIISGNMIHSAATIGSSFNISKIRIHSATIGSWYKYGGEYYRGIGRILGFVEDEHYYINIPNYPHANQNFKHDYAITVNELHSPVAIYEEVMYYSAEISDKDGCYTALYAIQSMQDEFRWQPWPSELSISYPLVSENVIVLYDIAVKEGGNIQKGRDSNIEPNLYTTEFLIAAYDIQSKGEIHSGTYNADATAPLTILNRSSANHSGKLFLEAGVIRNIKKEVITRVSAPNSRIIYNASGSKAIYERQLMASAYYAFDITTGNLIWKHNLGEKILNSPPLIYEDKIYIGSCYMTGNIFNINIPVNLKDSNNIFLALDTNNGKEIWRIEIVGNVLSRPLVYNDILYFGTDKGYVYAIDRFEGEIIWKFCINGGISSTPVVYDDILFIGSWNWNIYAIDTMTGRGIWKFRARGEVREDILAHDDHLYFVSQAPTSVLIINIPSRSVYLQSINIKTGIEQWNIVLKRDTFPFSHILLLSQDIIYRQSHGTVDAIDIKTGSILWDKQTEDFGYSALTYPAITIRKDKLNIIWRNRTQPLEVSISTFNAKTGEIIEGYNLADLNIHF